LPQRRRRYNPPPEFDGQTYKPSLDRDRLQGQLGRVFSLMADGEWRTLDQIADMVGGSTQSISARLRDLRKEKFGGYRVERRRREPASAGVFEYRLVAGGL